jgi:hypothetical protein
MLWWDEMRTERSVHWPEAPTLDLNPPQVIALDEVASNDGSLIP